MPTHRPDVRLLVTTCVRLLPIFFCQSYVKLLIRDVHGLGILGGIDDSHVLHGNKAIHRVEVSGTVVHVKPGATKASGSYGERSWEREGGIERQTWRRLQ